MLAFLAVVLIVGAVILDRVIRRRTIREALGVESEGGAVGQKPTEASTQLLAGVGKAVSSGKTSPDLRQRLIRGGYHKRNASQVFLGAKVLLLLVVMVAAVMTFLPMSILWTFKMAAIILLGGLAFFLPDILLGMKTATRRRVMHHDLPDVVDLMEICVSSGMSLGTAWNLVTDEIRAINTDLADEMALVDFEVHLGLSRVVAMRHMAERTGFRELRSLASTLIQAERFGTSIADALATFASDMRMARSADIEEAGEKLPVKLLVPMVLFIFPAFLIVVIGPAAITMYQQL